MVCAIGVIVPSVFAVGVGVVTSGPSVLSSNSVVSAEAVVADGVLKALVISMATVGGNSAVTSVVVTSVTSVDVSVAVVVVVRVVGRVRCSVGTSRVRVGGVVRVGLVGVGVTSEVVTTVDGGSSVRSVGSLVSPWVGVTGGGNC